MSGPTNVDYNVMAHLRKLPTNLSIYDVLILYKEMIYSYVKVLLNPKICLDKVEDMNYIEEETPIDMEGFLGITFHDSNLVLVHYT